MYRGDYDFKRAGEYLVFVEEDLRAKVIMYRLAV